MQFLVDLIIKIFSNPASQAALSWLATKIWNYISDKVKDDLSKERWSEYVKEVLSKYDKVIEEARIKAIDGLTEEEKNEIRRKKIELETELINNRPS